MQSFVLERFKIKRAVALALLVSLLSFAAGPAGATLKNEAERFVSVIVQGLTGSEARAAVESVGGTVELDLWIIDGVSARVPSNALQTLMASKKVRVSLDQKIAFHGVGSDSTTNHRTQKVVRSTNLWSEDVTGKGVTVALIDTGVHAHADLQGAVVACQDFTAERYTEANCQDTFGHGTFMAGLIAGDGTSSNGKYKGVAPDANLVAIKAAGYDGSTDVSTIIASIQFAVAFKDTYGIDVMNLSLGTDSMQDYRLSPLNYAVERAWNSGIVVVVSSGNTGPDAATVMKPGDDPFVITVGASDDMGSVSVLDDRVPVFSGRGPTRANAFVKPDVVAPGVHTVSLRSPGSAIDDKYGATGRLGDHYFKGTGTSMSTATVSGVVAQILQAKPTLNPNQVKYRLVSTARKIATLDPLSAGAGVVDAYAAARSSSTAQANQNIDPSLGIGLLALDRGSVGIDVMTPAGQLTLTGEFVAQTDPTQISLDNPGGLVPWAGTSWHETGWDGTSWHGTSWHTNAWAGTSWHGTSWHGTSWHGTSWHGTSWHNVDWDGTSWHGTSWHGTSWHGTSWHTYWYAAAWE